MKIMIGADTFAPHINGSAKFSERLAAGLAGRGHDVHVVCPSDDAKSKSDDNGRFIVHRIRSRHYPLHESFRICFPWHAVPEVADLVQELRPDVVHVQAHLVVGRAVVRAARAQRIPVVATNHVMPENLVGYVPLPPLATVPLARWIWRDLGRVYGHADLVTAPTPRAVELLEQRTPLREVRPISCGIDTARYQTTHGTADRAEATDLSAPRVLFVGRLDPEKRVDELIKAAANLPSEVPVQFEIIGEGDRYPELVELSRSLGVADRVNFRGYVSDEDVVDAYARADIFCMPGIAELQSLVTLEAMSAGLPVIAANAMALPHLVRPGQNGWLYTPGDIGELTFRLSTLIADPALRTRMGATSRQIVAQHGIDHTLDQFEAIYGSLRHAGGLPRRRTLRLIKSGRAA